MVDASAISLSFSVSYQAAVAQLSTLGCATKDITELTSK